MVGGVFFSGGTAVGMECVACDVAVYLLPGSDLCIFKIKSIPPCNNLCRMKTVQV